MNHVSLTVDKEPLEMNPMVPQFNHGFYGECYKSMWQAMNKMFKNSTIGFSRTEYAQGFAFYGFDLSTDGSGGECPNLPRRGEVGIVIGFRVNPTAALTLLAFGEKPGGIEIDAGGEVIEVVEA